MESQATDLILKNIKIAGNKAFKEKHYKEAEKLYTQFLSIRPIDTKVLSNRCAALTNLREIDRALADARLCIELDVNWTKGHFRLGSIYLLLEEWSLAKEAFFKALILDPDNKELKKLYDEAYEKMKNYNKEMKKQSMMYRRDLVQKLKEAKAEKNRRDILEQFEKNAMPIEWDPEDYEWHPIYYPMSKMATPVTCNDSDINKKIPFLKNYLKSLCEISDAREIFKILLDKERTEFFKNEIKAILNKRPECHILVMGCWGCPLLFSACEMGAKNITCVERSEILYEITKEVLNSNKDILGKCNINLVDGPIFSCYSKKEKFRDCENLNINLKDRVYIEKVDVVVTDLFDHSVLGLGIIKKLEHVSKYLIQEDCIVVPERIKINAMLTIYNDTDILGFDMSYLNKFMWHPHLKKINANKFLPACEEFNVCQIDLLSILKSKESEKSLLNQIEIKEKFIINLFPNSSLSGVCFWFEAFGQNYIPNSFNKSTCYNSKCNNSFGQAWHHLDSHFPECPNKEVVLKLEVDNDQLFFCLDPPLNLPRTGLLPDWHFDMIFDNNRNTSYFRAIKKAVERKSKNECLDPHVLDAGSGSGLLSLMASKCGACKVTAVEVIGHISDLCQEVVVMNGYCDRIQVINKDVRHMTMESLSEEPQDVPLRRADILVTEVFDCGLIGEGALHVICSSLKQLLTPNAILIPFAARVLFQAVEIDLFDPNYDLKCLDCLRSGKTYESINLKLKSYVALTESTKAFNFNFNDLKSDSGMVPEKRNLILEVCNSGILNAIIFWFELDMEEGEILSTSPYVQDNCESWGQAIQWIESSIKVEKGNLISITAEHDTYGISFKILEDQGHNKNFPQYFIKWSDSFEKMNALTNNICKTMVQNPLERRYISQGALNIASRPTTFGLPSKASEFCLNLLN